MRNRAASGRLGIVIWVVVAVLGDIALALAPIPPGQASTLASDESEVIRILAMAGWPIFFGVLMGLYFMLFLNRIAPSEREVPRRRTQGQLASPDDVDRHKRGSGAHSRHLWDRRARE